MRRHLAAAALLLAATTSAASAKETILNKSGFWITSHIDRNTGGQPMCMMLNNFGFEAGATGKVMVKQASDGEMWLHIYKSNWNFEAGIDVPLFVSFDNGQREAVGVTTRTADNRGSYIEVAIPQDKVAGVLEDFADADRLTITFREGNEAPWISKMDGSRNATKVFRHCTNYIGATAATSPIGKPMGEPSSPVKSVPQATSPFPPVGEPAPAKKQDRATVGRGGV